MDANGTICARKELGARALSNTTTSSGKEPILNFKSLSLVIKALHLKTAEKDAILCTPLNHGLHWLFLKTDQMILYH